MKFTATELILNFTDIKVPSTINSSDNDLMNDFFIPILKTAHLYKRGVGYFSSGWLQISSEGLIEFIGNGGKAFWITSPILSYADWEAIKSGNDARTDILLHEALQKNIEELELALEADTLSALAWMVADGLLEFKLAVLKGKLDGEFHDKFGIFSDSENNTISFNGSYNESIQGTRNYESFKVFKSWLPDQTQWVEEDELRFDRLWNNQDLNVRVLNISEANKESILKLRHFDRPYKKPQEVFRSKVSNSNPISLRDYQEKAISAWFSNQCCGFFEMATGTGKTITALAASKRVYEKEGAMALIIAVPYQHLVDQWQSEASRFGYISILAYKGKKLWIDKLNNQIVEYNNKYRNLLVVITTHDTFTDLDFQSSIGRIERRALLIADEAHHLGTEIAQMSYPLNVPYRLALSATPERWFDESGTTALRDYFGKTVFELTLKDAIGISLTPYYYYPVIVTLTEEEIERYKSYSLKIARFASQGSSINDERIKYWLLKRAAVLNRACNKLAVLSDLLKERPIKSHTLFYCAPGQINEVISLVGTEMGFQVHPFTSEETAEERQELLASFSSGKLQALAAIKCLDEGVDVPSTEIAYLLASSSNPREFIQRRGRILRKAPGKKHSHLYDLITIPPDFEETDKDSAVFQLERKIMTRELSRFKEFAEHSLNKHHAIDVIWSIAKRYQLMDF